MTALSVQAEVVHLRQIETDESGGFTVLFSVLDRGEPVGGDAITLNDLVVEAGQSQSEMELLELDDQLLLPLRDFDEPFRVVFLLPDTRLFNDSFDSGLRQAFLQAVRTLPARPDIHVRVGLFNDDVYWLPSEYDTTRLEELESDLARRVSDEFMEDPLNAVENTVRSQLSRESRPRGNNDFITFFVPVTSGEQSGNEDEVVRRLTTLRERLESREFSDVVTLSLIYVPGTDDELVLNDPGSAGVRFAEGLSPNGSNYRIEGTRAGIQSAFQETIDEISRTYVLRFNNRELESDRNHHFRLELTRDGGLSSSNVLEAHVKEREFNLWKWVLIGTGSLVGLVLLLFLVLWFVKRPKGEDAEVVEVSQSIPMCVQCARALDQSLLYCSHCANEPNYGILKVLEGPDAPWTFFLRDFQTVIGKGYGPPNSVRLRDPGISGTHCQITVQEGGRYLLEDLKSTNGTFIEGHKITRQYLRNGAVIVMGATKFKFTIS
jgi:hypothetical protein